MCLTIAKIKFKAGGSDLRLDMTVGFYTPIILILFFYNKKMVKYVISVTVKLMLKYLSFQQF